MSVVEFISDVGNAIYRVIQQIEERMFDAEKTDYDDEYIGNLKRLDTLIHFTTVLIDDTESMLEPNPAYRLEGKVMEKVDKRNDRATPLENLGTAFENASHDVKQFHYELYKDFALCSKYQTRLGLASKEFQNKATDIYVSKLKTMLDVDLKKYKEEEEILENLRLDYDSLKIRIKKAITVVGKESLEREFEEVKPAFLKKLEYNTSYFRDIDRFFEVHRDLLKEFVVSQSKYYKDCHGELERFKSKMITRNLSSYNENESEIYQTGRTSLRKEYASKSPNYNRELPPINISESPPTGPKKHVTIDSALMDHSINGTEMLPANDSMNAGHASMTRANGLPPSKTEDTANPTVMGTLIGGTDVVNGDTDSRVLIKGHVNVNNEDLTGINLKIEIGSNKGIIDDEKNIQDELSLKEDFVAEEKCDNDALQNGSLIDKMENDKDNIIGEEDEKKDKVDSNEEELSKIENQNDVNSKDADKEGEGNN